MYHTPLFADEIQAWACGPVIPTIYSIYTKYKWLDIPQQPYDGTALDAEAICILESVYATYAKFSGDQLESLARSEKPWIVARGGLQPWETCTNSISIELMQTYYGR